MALTTIKTGAISDDAVTEDKIANAINTARAANTAKDLTALSASNLTSGTVPDARFPATLPAASAANLTAVPAANITGTLPAISGANLTGISSAGKATNLIINGAMQVAQRGTSSTTSGYGSLDRWNVSHAGTDEAITHSQIELNSSDTGPWQKGFHNALRLTNGNQTSGFQASSYVLAMQHIEDQNIANSGWQIESSSSYITVSYWIRSSVSQEFFGHVETYDGTDKTYIFSTGTLSANTWTKITKTIPGDSALSMSNNNGQGLQVEPVMIWGTNYTASDATINGWAAFDGGKRTTDMASSWWTTNDATLDITGVQCEVGDSATDFAHRSYAQEFALCQRYYYVTDPTADNFCGGGGLFMYDSGDSSISYGSLTFAQTMRAAPTVVLRDNNGNKDSKVTQHGIAHDIAATAGDINETGFSKVNKSSGNFSTGAGKPIICGCTANAEL